MSRSFLLAGLLLAILPTAASHEGHASGCEERDDASYVCIGTISLGALGFKVEGSNAAVGADGVSAVSVPLPDSAGGRAFTLRAVGGSSGILGPADFDLQAQDAAGAALADFEAVGPERGELPPGSARALVVLYDGRNAEFELRLEP